MKTRIIFPHQLFEDISAYEKGTPIYLVEEYLFFKQYHFHKQKIVFHRCTMKFYAAYLQQNGFTVQYIEAIDKLSDIRKLIPYLKTKGIKQIAYTDTTDNWLEKRINSSAAKNNIGITINSSPLFINSKNDIDSYFAKRVKFQQTEFYMQQRKSRNILLEKDLKPVGGKWTYDTENRLKYPKGKTPPAINHPGSDAYFKEAKSYCDKYFSSNYGSVGDLPLYAANFNDSKKWLKEFLQKRFDEFGPYEDAMVSDATFLHHSVLTPMLNIGLITPQHILEETIDYYHQHNIPLASAEGFIRQVIGWREFMRGMYETKGCVSRTHNYWKFKRKIPTTFWNGTTGIKPIDTVINKILATGYCHHIERLMVLGNFMVLCEFDPDDVYRWFMEMFIDAYDWVMVPNVYSMSQFADGGLLASKPYISGSNYLMKMSDFPKGDWQQVWDGLFWRFMHVHRNFFSSNPRLGMLLKTFDKMPDEKRNRLLHSANEFLASLDVIE